MRLVGSKWRADRGKTFSFSVTVFDHHDLNSKRTMAVHYHQLYHRHLRLSLHYCSSNSNRMLWRQRKNPYWYWKKTTKNERHRNFIRKNWKEVSQIDLWNEELCIQRLLWRVNNELSKWKANNRLAVYALDAVSACVCIVYISMENVFHNHQHLLYGC